MITPAETPFQVRRLQVLGEQDPPALCSWPGTAPAAAAQSHEGASMTCLADGFISAHQLLKDALL